MSQHDKPTEKALAYLIDLLVKARLVGWASAQQWMANRGVRVASFDDLTQAECSRLIQLLDKSPKRAFGDPVVKSIPRTRRG